MKRLERLFHILAFILQCGGIVPLFLRTGDDAADLGTANPMNTVATAFVLIVTLALFRRHAGTAFRYFPRMWPILALVLLAVISAAWSDYPDITVRRCASFVTATLWAWYITSRFDLKDVISIVRQSAAIMVVASFVIAVGAPSIGGEDPSGPAGWRGIFANKNDLGMAVAIGAVTNFYTLISRRPKMASFISQVVALLLCLVLLRLAQSSTSLVVAMMGILLCVIVRMTYRRVGMAIMIWGAILLLLGPAIVFVMNQLGALAPLVGRDAELTGRVDLWLIVPSYIADRPWLGHGFGAFWVADSRNVALIWNAVGWQPPHSHNGWLDLLLELGAVGFVILALQILLIVINGIRAVVDGSEADAQFTLVITFMLLIYNITESNLARPGVWWILLVIVVTALARIATERKPAARERRRRYAGFQRPATLNPSGTKSE